MLESIKEKIAWHWNMNRHTLVIFGMITAISAAMSFLGHGGSTHDAFAHSRGR